MEQMTGHRQAMAAAGRQLMEYVSNIQEEGRRGESKEQYEQRISAKLRLGKKLTADEMDYLAKNNPVMYQKALRAQMMRKALEERLKACTSKQEAESVYANAMSSISENDPDREILTAALSDAYQEFCQTQKYKKLPQTQEEAEERDGHNKMEIALNDSGYQETYMAQESVSPFSAKA